MLPTHSIPSVANEETRGRRAGELATGNIPDESSPTTRPQAPTGAAAQRASLWSHRIQRLHRAYRKLKTERRPL